MQRSDRRWCIRGAIIGVDYGLPVFEVVAYLRVCSSENVPEKTGGGAWARRYPCGDISIEVVALRAPRHDGHVIGWTWTLAKMSGCIERALKVGVAVDHGRRS